MDRRRQRGVTFTRHRGSGWSGRPNGQGWSARSRGFAPRLLRWSRLAVLLLRLACRLCSAYKGLHTPYILSQTFPEAKHLNDPWEDRHVTLQTGSDASFERGQDLPPIWLAGFTGPTATGPATYGHRTWLGPLGGPGKSFPGVTRGGSRESITAVTPSSGITASRPRQSTWETGIRTQPYRKSCRMALEKKTQFGARALQHVLKKVLLDEEHVTNEDTRIQNDTNIRLCYTKPQVFLATPHQSEWPQK